MWLSEQKKERGEDLFAKFRAAYAVNQKYCQCFLDVVPQHESEKPDAKRMNNFRALSLRYHGMWPFSIGICALLIRSLVPLDIASKADTKRFLADLKFHKSAPAAIEQIYEQYEDTYPIDRDGSMGNARTNGRDLMP